MNGLYNMLFGEDPRSSRLLEMLDLVKESFGRYRDCYLNEDGTRIIVLTRCGGFNRNDYDFIFYNMREHPNYICDYDDAVDETYCYFEFSVPYIFSEETKSLANGKKPMTVGEKFDKEIKEMDDPNSEASKRAQKIAESINKQMEAQPNGGIIWMGEHHES